MPTLEHISVGEMRLWLREAYSQDAEKSFLRHVMRGLRDPARSVDANHRVRVHPLWLRLGLIAGLVLAALIFFTFLQH